MWVWCERFLTPSPIFRFAMVPAAFAQLPMPSLDVLDSFSEWLDGYCDYHATMMLELSGRVCGALNNVIIERWEANGQSNDSRVIAHSQGASEFFENLHTRLLAMRRYTSDRISRLVPATAASLRKPYGP